MAERQYTPITNTTPPDPRETEIANAKATLAVSDAAAGDLARAQKWRCVGCGLTLASGSGILARVVCKAQKRAAFTVMIHPACLDDAKLLGDLGSVWELADEGPGANKDMALKAQRGALENAVDEAITLCEALPRTARKLKDAKLGIRE